MRDIGTRTRGSASRMHRLDRWMYQGGHPNRLARVLNRVSAVHFSSGAFARDNWVEMRVRGRRTGRVISFPLVVADHEGERYVVAMLGERAQWVRNVRAAGGRVTLRHGRTEHVRLVEVDPALRAPILRRHLALAPGARAHVPVAPDAPLEAFERVAGRIPVFRITPDAEPGRCGRSS